MLGVFSKGVLNNDYTLEIVYDFKSDNENNWVQLNQTESRRRPR